MPLCPATGDKPWISEMYGYSFGCAKANVWHITHSEHMLYPGYDTVGAWRVAQHMRVLICLSKLVGGWDMHVFRVHSSAKCACLAA